MKDVQSSSPMLSANNREAVPKIGDLPSHQSATNCDTKAMQLLSCCSKRLGPSEEVTGCAALARNGSVYATTILTLLLHAHWACPCL